MKKVKGIDYNRLDYCIKIGRRFYILTQLLLKYIRSYNLYSTLSYLSIPLNFCGYISNQIILLSQSRYDTFNPLNDSPSRGRSSCCEIFNLFNSKYYVNIYSKIDNQEFMNKYGSDFYTPYKCCVTLYKTLKKIHIKQIPVEINIGDDQTIRSDDQKLKFRHRRTLIELLYFSNSVLKWFEHFNNYLITDTIFYNSILYMNIDKDKYLSYNSNKLEIPHHYLKIDFYKKFDLFKRFTQNNATS